MAERVYHKCRACPKLSINEKTRLKRFEFYEERFEWRLSRLKTCLWSDECFFSTGKQPPSWMIRTKRERYCVDCLQ